MITGERPKGLSDMYSILLCEITADVLDRNSASDALTVYETFGLTNKHVARPQQLLLIECFKLC